MACPYREKRIPPCDFQIHPYKGNIEYCRICGDWRDLNKIGGSTKSKFPGKTLLALMVTAIAFLFLKGVSPLGQSDTVPARNNSSVELPASFK